MAQKFSNNATSRLAGSILSSDVVLTVEGGTGELFPPLDGNDDTEFSILTLEDGVGNMEIVKAKDRNGDQFLKLERGHEGTTARDWAATTRCELRLTAAVLSAFFQRDGDVLDGGTF